MFCPRIHMENYCIECFKVKEPEGIFEGITLLEPQFRQVPPVHLSYNM